MGRQQPQVDDASEISEDGRGNLDMTERIRKRRKARIREEAEETGSLTKVVPVPLKPGERVV